MTDYYEVLGVAPDATQEQIKAAYRRLASVWHPDKTGGQTKYEFQAIQEAYDVLSDPQRRQTYNAGGNPHNQVATVSDMITAEAHRGMMQLLDQIFEQWDESSLKRRSVTDEIIARVDAILAILVLQRRQTRRLLGKCRQLRKRLKNADHFTVLHLRNKRVELLNRWVAQRRNAKVLQRIREMAETMEYEVDQLAPAQAMYTAKNERP